MERYYTKIIGTPVYEDGIRPITTVKDLVMDPENGKIIALVVNINRNMVITPMDILSWYEGIKIHHEDAIISGDEILRVQNIQKSGIKVSGSKVVTKEGIYLGKVVDFSIDPNSLILQKLFIAKEFLGLLRYDSRILPYSAILEILPGKIIVKSDTEKIKDGEKNKVKLEDAAVV